MISLSFVNKYYTSSEDTIHVLKDINLNVAQGEMVAIMGPSGSGKSTLLNIMGFIDGRFEGSYLFEGEDLSGTSDKYLSKIRNQSVGFIFQDFSLIENYTIFENIELPLLYGEYAPKQTKEKVLNILRKVGLEGKEKKYPHQLSGGQKQRVAIARALINEPKFIIADEPTGSLDSNTSREIMTLFKKINATNEVTIILVTHDSEVVSYCSRIIQIKDGYILENEEFKV